MADVPGKFYRATKVRTGVSPSSAGSIEGEPLPPVNPPGSSLNSVGLTMPSAFTVSNSPLTANGTIGVAGAGTVAQYIRGDGSLADFPETSGGGASVSYYLNGSVSQGTIGGIAYREMNKVPIFGAGTDFTINADGYIASFITDSGDPNLIEIPGGNWNFETYFSSSSSGGTPTFYLELYKVNSGGTATLIASNSANPEFIAFGTNITAYFTTLAVPTTTLALTDRLAVRYYVTHSGRTITMHTEGPHLCQIITTFTTGLTALNGLTAQVQNFAVGTTGTDFNIASSVATHTFNLPTASATNRGALSSADWALFTQAYNDKINSAAVTGTTTKTLTLTQQDGGTITASWSDLNTDAVLSVFGRTGAVVAANGDYTTAQVTESGNLYYTDARSRAALSFAAGSGAYNTSTGVITIPTNNNQITNGAGYITSAALAGYLPLTGGTLTGPLGGTSASFSGSVTATDLIQVDSATIAAFRARGGGYGTLYNTSLRSIAGAIGVLQLGNNADNYILAGNTATNGFLSIRVNVSAESISSGTEALRINSNATAIFYSTVTATSIIRSGGTSSQYLMADGSVSTLSNPVTGTGTTNYLPKFTGSTTIGNSNIISDGSGKFSLGTAATHGNATFEQTTGEAGLVVNSSIAESPTIYLRDAGGAGYSTILANNNLYLNASRVGIGIATPNANSRLHVYRAGGSYDTIVADGDAGTNTGFAIYEGGSARYALYSNGAGGNDSFNIYNFGAAGNSFTIYTSGNVGINSSSDNGAKLQVSGTATVSSSLTANGLNALGSTLNNGNAFRFYRAGLVEMAYIGWSNENTNNSTWYFKSSNGNPIGFSADGVNQQVTIATSGNVGIGVSPSTRLEVTSNSSGSTEVQRWSYDQGNVGYSLRLKQDVSSGLVKHIFDVVNNSTTYANNLVLTNGKVGIKQISPLAPLHVASESSADDANVQRWDYDGSTAYQLILKQTVTSGVVRWNFSQINNNTTYNNVLVLDRGNVGIGTPSPGRLLTLSATIPVFQLVNPTTGTTADDGLLIYQNGVNSVIENQEAGELSFRTSASPRMTITSGGNVGIGINPQARLQVFGGTGAYPTLGTNVANSLFISRNDGLLGTYFGYAADGNGWIQQMRNDSATAYNLVLQPVGGNVLIGTTTDSGNKLEVAGTVSTSGNFVATSSGIAEIRLRGGGYGVSYNTSLRSIVGAAGVLQFGNNADNYILAGNTATGGYLRFRVNCNTESISSGSLALTLNANATAVFESSVTATSFFESSDATLKTLIADNYQAKGIDSVVAKLYIKNGKEELGYFAQELQGVLPSAVSKGSDGLLNLSYREVHTAKIAYLEEEIRQIKKRYEIN